jgi:hypothetical protein
MGTADVSKEGDDELVSSASKSRETKETGVNWERPCGAEGGYLTSNTSCSPKHSFHFFRTTGVPSIGTLSKSSLPPRTL